MRGNPHAACEEAGTGNGARVHFCYGPVTCSPSQGWLCQLASSASFPPHGCTPSYGALTFTPVGPELCTAAWT